MTKPRVLSIRVDRKTFIALKKRQMEVGIPVSEQVRRGIKLWLREKR